MLRRVKKSGQPPAAGSPEKAPSPGGKDWEEVDRFLEEMASLAGDEAALEGAAATAPSAMEEAPVPSQTGGIVFFHPGQPDKPLSFEALSLLSLELDQLFRAGGFDQTSLPNLRALAVRAGEVVGRVVGPAQDQAGQEVFGRGPAPALESPQGRVAPGEGVVLNEAGEYRTERYGYLCLAEGRLAVLSPLWLDAGAMHAYWVILDEAAQPVTAEMIRQCLQDQGVIEGILEEQLADLVAQVCAGQHQCGLHLVAQGQRSVDGQDAQVEFLVDLQRRAGTERPDGSIDFREVNFTPSAGPGQVIARRIPPKPGEVGWNVKGQVLPAREGQDLPLKAGANVEVGLEEEVEVFSAAIEGMVKRREGEVSVVRQLVHRGDVNFDTGNLDFKGEVHIGGSVVHGFSVKATGDITIAGTVEESSAIVAQGDITVGQGILGRRTQVAAHGSVRAQFVQESRVRAGGNIVLGNYAYHAYLYAGGKVILMKGTGSRSGGVLGGEIWGLEGIEVHVAGSPNWATCTLIAGLQPEQAQQLDKLKANAGVCHEHIMKVLGKFNLTRVDLGQIRNMLAAATGPQRKVLMHQARQLGQLVQLYQKLQGERSELESRISTSVKGASIKALQIAHGGVIIRIGEYQRKLSADVKNPNFHVHKGKMVEG